MSDDDLDFMPAAGDAKSEGPASADKSSSDKSGSKPEPKPEGDRLPGERAELPTWNRSRRKRKVNVKAELEDDAFQRGVRKASRQVIDTPKLAMGAILIAVVAIAGGVALRNRSIEANAEASRTLQTATAAIVRGQVVPPEELERLGDAVKLYRIPIFTSDEERDAAIAEAMAAAKTTGRSKIDQDALLVSAAQAMRAGDFDTALGEYQQFLDDAGDAHPLRFMALEGKGNALEAKGDYEAALATFQELAPRTTDYYRAMALYHQGRVLESLERRDEALAIYQQFFEEFPTEQVATPMIRARVEDLDPDFAARLAAPPPSPFPMP